MVRSLYIIWQQKPSANIEQSTVFWCNNKTLTGIPSPSASLYVHNQVTCINLQTGHHAMAIYGQVNAMPYMANTAWLLTDATWHQRSLSTLAQVMVCCLTAPNHYLNQCWLITNEILWHSFQGNIYLNTQDIFKSCLHSWNHSNISHGTMS